MSSVQHVNSFCLSVGIHFGYLTCPDPQLTYPLNNIGFCLRFSCDTWSLKYMTTIHFWAIVWPFKVRYERWNTLKTLHGVCQIHFWRQLLLLLSQQSLKLRHFVLCQYVDSMLKRSEIFIGYFLSRLFKKMTLPPYKSSSILKGQFKRFWML